MSSPPAPPALPPPNRETDVAFGATLVILGFMLLAFTYYLPTLVKRLGYGPETETSTGSTTEKEAATNAAFSTTGLRPLKLG
jgi:hypothetical protein